LESRRDDPDGLAPVISLALQHGCAADAVPYAEHLLRTDPVAARAATLLGIAYLQTGRLDDAERVLEDVLSEHGENASVLTSLAQVYSRRGDDERAEAALWRALQADPNQDTALYVSAAMHHERGGDAAVSELYRRAADLPGSWRPQLWLAREALGEGAVDAARELYDEALSRAGDLVPPDLLMQMSGDLGAAGHLEEIVRLVGPHFDPAVHGLAVGNNLVKAYHDLGRAGEARRVLDTLRTQDRPDWRETLDYWAARLDEAG
jgi:Tfp pilus assembly protein PilF